MNTGRRTTIEDVNKIKLLLSKGLDYLTIAQIVDVSDSTVKRVENGTHYLLKRLADQQNLANQQKEDEPKEVKLLKVSDTAVIYKKLDTIIFLLEKLNGMGGNNID